MNGKMNIKVGDEVKFVAEDIYHTITEINGGNLKYMINGVTYEKSVKEVFNVCMKAN